MDLTLNFLVLCTNMKVYLYNYSKWVEPSMIIHEVMGYMEFNLISAQALMSRHGVLNRLSLIFSQFCGVISSLIWA